MAETKQKEVKDTTADKKMRIALGKARKKRMLVSLVKNKFATKAAQKAYIKGLSRPTHAGMKPDGNKLWLSSPRIKDRSWYAWAKIEMPEKLANRTVVGFKIKHDRRLLSVTTLSELEAFVAMFGKEERAESKTDASGDEFSDKRDWPSVAKTYSGVIFMPYLSVRKKYPDYKDRRWHWYLILDVETTIVWDADIVKAYEILR